MNAGENEIIHEAINLLREGKIIGYPTESVFGLGCDPFNEAAVLELLALKKRSVEKGLILIVANWEQLEKLVCPVDENIKKKILGTKDPVTWVLPAKNVPAWVRGKFDTVAIRICLHPIAKKLCEKFGGAIVSTSANVEGQLPAKTADQVREISSDVFVVEGQVGDARSPSRIQNALTDAILRNE